MKMLDPDFQYAIIFDVELKIKSASLKIGFNLSKVWMEPG